MRLSLQVDKTEISLFQSSGFLLGLLHDKKNNLHRSSYSGFDYPQTAKEKKFRHLYIP
jgi:hypothetical protein